MYRVSESVRSTHGQDGGVLLDIRKGQMFNLNFVGSRIVELVKAGSSESEITGEISREFSIERDLAEQDVREFLQTLQKHCLVEEQESGSAI